MVVCFYRIKERLVWVLDKLLRCICKWDRALDQSLAQTVYGENSVDVLGSCILQVVAVTKKGMKVRFSRNNWKKCVTLIAIWLGILNLIM